MKKKAAAPIDFFGSSKVKKDPKPVVKKVNKPSNNISENDISAIDIDDFSDDESFEDPSFKKTLDTLDKKKQKVSLIFILSL